MDLPPDRHILDGIRSGDAAAFKTLFMRHYRQLCLYAHDFLGNAQQAEEIAADVFAGIWRNRQQLQLEQLSTAYLRKAVFNRCANTFRREKLKNLYLDYVRRHPHFFEDGLSPGKQMESQEYQKQILMFQLKKTC